MSGNNTVEERTAQEREQARAERALKRDRSRSAAGLLFRSGKRLTLGMLIGAVVACLCYLLLQALQHRQRARQLPAAPAIVKVTVPEGLTREQVAATVRKHHLRGNYLAATATARAGKLDLAAFGVPVTVKTLEGFLFPDTYELVRNGSVNGLVAKQLQTFQARFKSVDLAHAKSLNLTAYDVLIIASMIDREVRVPAERPLVAAVIYNRLKHGIPLGIDATVRYATGNWTKPLTGTQLKVDSPYNTRKKFGLPPTPIGNPGLEAIEAAAHPAAVDYLYYVVKPGTCGHHDFSSTVSDFSEDVKHYQLERARHHGSSPVRCQ